MEKKKLLIIDSNSILHRTFWALPPLTTKKGELINALYGFFSIFILALKKIKPDFVVACYDFPAKTFRHKEFKLYKAKRKKAPTELYSQIEKSKEILKKISICVLEKEGYEADDLIASVKELFQKKQIFPKLVTIILTGDLDPLQLVDSQTKVLAMKKGISETIFYDEKEIAKRFSGLKPFQLLDLKGLTGDPSDNIPGVPGIGKKTALFLIKKFNTIEEIYQRIEKGENLGIKASLLKKLIDYKEQAFFSKKIAKIKRDIPLSIDFKGCLFKNFNLKKALEIFGQYEFSSLIKRLKELFSEKKLKDNLSEKISQEKKLKLFYKEKLLSKKLYQIEKELIAVIDKMEKKGIKIDLKALSLLSEKLEEKLAKIKKAIFSIVGEEFNLNSPSQLRAILFEKLKISSDFLRKTSKGEVSTGKDELRKLKDTHPVVDLILEYREIFKLKTSFCDNLKKYIDPKDSRIHPKFQQIGTVTGRITCKEPNLQAIPKEGRFSVEIRRAFVAEDGYLFLSADYSQIELRIIAFFSGEEKWIEIFKKGGDIHQMVAEQIFQKKDISFKERRLAKIINYGILYGMGPKTLSFQANISLAKAKEFVNNYFKEFPRVKEFFESLVKKAKKDGFLETLLGRRRSFFQINSRDLRLRQEAERMAKNFPIQGTVADIVKKSMLEIERELIKKYGKEKEKISQIILQIHDELIFEVKEDYLSEIAKVIKEITEKTVSLEPVPLKVNISVGKNLAELKPINLSN